MITRNTVFILGAGASLHCGFPTGVNLKEIILQGLALKSSDTCTLILKHAYCTHKRIEEFRVSFEQCGLPSIDAFLEGKDKEFQEIGKLAIACSLIPYEKMPALFNNVFPYQPNQYENWYDYLFLQMLEGCKKLKDFADNKVSFLTYNYDRSLSAYLSTVLANRFEARPEEVRDTLDNITMVHLHGQLGTLEEEPYSPELSERLVERCAKGIFIIHDSDVEKRAEFQRAEKVLLSADIICFLGFGYHATNIKRLPLNKCDSARKLGTTFGLTQGEMVKLNERFNFPKPFECHSNTILSILRESQIIADSTPFYGALDRIVLSA